MRPPEHTHESEGRASPGHCFTVLSQSMARRLGAPKTAKYSRFSELTTRLALVHRFRSSHPVAARPFCELGNQKRISNSLISSAALNLKFLNELAANAAGTSI